MNKKVFVLCFSLFFLVSAFVTSDVIAAWSPPADTDVCWGASGHIYRLRFIDVGGGYYQIVGKTTETGGIIGALFGSAITTPSVIKITATNSGSNASGDIWTDTGRYTLNRTTLKLTLNVTGMNHDKLDPDPQHVDTYFNGPHTVPKIQCP